MSILNTVGNSVTDSILQDTGLDWRVEKTAGIFASTSDGMTASTAKRCATVRTDTNEILGIVGNDYKVVQNEELAYMAERISGSNLKVTNAGELRNGSRVWMSVKAPSFNVGTVDDEVKPYLLLSNGHDGLFSLSGTPTSIRVVCENTLNMALRQGRRQGMLISIRHKGDMEEKIEHLTDTLSEFYERSKEFSKQAEYLAKAELNSGQVSDYYKAIYNTYVEEIPSEVTSAKHQRQHNKWQSTMMKWWDTYDTESASLGSNMWVAFNSITNWVDHSSSFRGDKKSENRFFSNFYGGNAIKKNKILETSLAIA